MTLSLEGLRAALAYPNVAAMLRCIRERETGQGANAYLTINGGAQFSSFAAHPYDDVPTTKGGRAAGAYQFLGTTWANLCEQYEFPDFSPDSQDLGAIALIKGRGALSDVIAGRFEAAVAKLRPEWTSLPGASESSSSWTMDKAKAVFVHWGGKLDDAALLDEQPAAPIEERDLSGIPPQTEKPMAEQQSTSFGWGDLLKVAGPIASMFNPIVGMAITAFTPLLQEKIGKELGRHTDPQTAATVAASLTDVITKVAVRETGKVDPEEAVLAMRKDPTVLAKAEAAVTNRLSELAPFFDKLEALESKERADTIVAQDAASTRAKGEAWDMTPWLVGFAGGMVLIVVLLFGAVAIIDIVKTGKVATEVWAALTGISGTLLGILGTIFAYRFSSTQQSATKNAIIGEIARRA